MQFTDLIFKFLDRLGYSDRSRIVTTITEASADGAGSESPGILVLGKSEERVIGVFMLSDDNDRRSTVVKSAALRAYCEQFDGEVGKYIINHTASQDSTEGDTIEFYKCETNSESSKVDIDDFPSYSEMWLLNSLESKSRMIDCEKRRSSTLAGYAYFFAFVFLALAVGDIFVEKMLDMSYLNTQRVLLLIGSVLLLLVPGFLRNKCRTQP